MLFVLDMFLDSSFKTMGRSMYAMTAPAKPGNYLIIYLYGQPRNKELKLTKETVLYR